MTGAVSRAYSLHRVTPTEGDVTRMLAVLAYNTQPGIALSETARMTFTAGYKPPARASRAGKSAGYETQLRRASLHRRARTLHQLLPARVRRGLPDRPADAASDRRAPGGASPHRISAALHHQWQQLRVRQRRQQKLRDIAVAVAVTPVSLSRPAPVNSSVSHSSYNDLPQSCAG